ncbi:RING finger protein 208 [Alosa sapidissima]|uniref:RING finger protein 208 n=1 Tax=Alosa sapidissima TaxID=34773 RepID=UPI001C091C25|nr:RING finger protein 208 [Alosa sapidissima]
MSCLRRQPVAIPMDTVKIIQSEKFPRECPVPVTQPRFAPPPRVAWDGGGRGGSCIVSSHEGEVIVNQACSDLALELTKPPPPPSSQTPPPPRPLVSPPHGLMRRELSAGPGPGGFLSQRKSSLAASVGGPTEICYHQFHYKMDDVIVNQYVLRSGSTSSGSSSTSSGSSVCSGPVMPSCEPLDCPTCGHVYNFAGKRPRILSCLHSVCEECLQILYESCPKYKFISCPTCRRETVLFTDYGLAALAINTSILSRLPPDPAGTVQWGGDADRSCYQTVRQYCQSACTCHLTNPLSSCGIM